MKTVEIAEQERLQVKQENIIQMPLGLLGFEHIKKFVLLANPEEAPFMWLQMLDNANQGFVVVPPSSAHVPQGSTTSARAAVSLKKKSICTWNSSCS